VQTSVVCSDDVGWCIAQLKWVWLWVWLGRVKTCLLELIDGNLATCVSVNGKEPFLGHYTCTGVAPDI